MIAQKEYKFVRFVEFVELVRWDVKTYINSNSTNQNLVCLGDYIKEQSKKVKLFDYPEEEFGILGVNNQIGIFDAYLEKGCDINQSYKEMQENWLAYNPYRINVGSIGIKTKEHKYKYISPAYVVFSCKETLLPEFLFNIFKTDAFNKLIIDNTTGSVRQNLSFTNLSQIQLAIPPLATQKQLVENYKAKTTLAQAKEQKANELEKSIDEYLTAELGIEIQKKEVVESEYKFLRFVGFEELERWGVEFLLSNTSKILFSKKYSMHKLSETVKINPRTELKEKDLEISFLPMECVSDIYGEVINYKDGNVNQSKGYTRFQEGDLIWAKITPCMQNGKSTILKNLKNKFGYGSTEFYVIRNDNQNINIEYIYNILRMQIVRTSATHHFTGTAGQQRVPVAFLENLQLPLPPLSIQTQIAKHIGSLKEEIKTLRTKANELKTNAKAEFEGAVFG